MFPTRFSHKIPLKNEAFKQPKKSEEVSADEPSVLPMNYSSPGQNHLNMIRYRNSVKSTKEETVAESNKQNQPELMSPQPFQMAADCEEMAVEV